MLITPTFTFTLYSGHQLMLLRLILTIVASVLFSLANAQILDVVHLKFKISDLGQTDSCQIAYHVGAKQYIHSNGILTYHEGYFHFEADSVAAGLYLFVFPDKSYFEFLLNEPQFTMSTISSDPVPNMVVAGSEENRVFYDYLNYLNTKRGISERLTTEHSQANEEIKEQLNQVNKQVEQYRASVISNHSDMMVGQFFKANQEPDFPKAPKTMSAEKARIFEFYQYRKRYFNNIDLNKEYLMYTPIVSQKVANYLEKCTNPSPDSQLVSVQRIMAWVQGFDNPTAFKLLIIEITNRYAQSKKLCYDKVYVYMVETYYMTGKADWADEAQLARMKYRSQVLGNVQCGSKALNFTLKDSTGRDVSLYDVHADKMVIIFWRPDCGHCKKVTQALRSLYQEKGSRFTVVAVNVSQDKEKWMEYIRANKLNGWLHLYNEGEARDFSKTHDVSKTPKLIILDKNKTIRFKDIGVEYIEQLLGI